jgi:hypothetical protein
MFRNGPERLPVFFCAKEVSSSPLLLCPQEEEADDELLLEELLLPEQLLLEQEDEELLLLRSQQAWLELLIQFSTGGFGSFEKSIQPLDSQSR